MTHRPPGLFVRCVSCVRPLDLIVWGVGITFGAVVAGVGAAWVVLRDLDLAGMAWGGDDDE